TLSDIFTERLTSSKKFIVNRQVIWIVLLKDFWRPTDEATGENLTGPSRNDRDRCAPLLRGRLNQGFSARQYPAIRHLQPDSAPRDRSHRKRLDYICISVA